MTPPKRRALWALTRRDAWDRRWRDTQGVGETVGAVFGIMLLVFGLTGSLSAYRLWQVHQTLVHAASVALRSEEQQGCWTASTSQAVGTVAQGAGLNPHGVKVTQFTANTADYGQPVTVTLSYQTNIDYLFGGLSAWTEQASLSGSSFYVPATMTGSNGGCTAPSVTGGSGGSGGSGSSGSSGSTPPSGLQLTLATTTPEATQQSYTASGVLTGGGIDLPNTLVTLSDGSQTLGSATTNNAGQYSIAFTAPSAGSYTYTATADGATATQSITVAALKPAISSVTFSHWTKTGATITITGKNLGSTMPTLSTANGGGNNSQALALHYKGQSAGYQGNAWGLTYQSWSSSQVVVQYPGSWTAAGSGVGDTWPLNGGSLTVDVWAYGQETTDTVTVPANPLLACASNSGTIAVSSVSFSTGGDTLTSSTTVTVNGSNLPVLASCDPGQQSVTDGTDFPNFFFTDAPPKVVQQGNYNSAYSYFGSTQMPYSGMWGVTVLKSTASQLQFTMPKAGSGNGSLSGPWYFYMKPDGQTLSLTTPYIYEYPTGLLQQQNTPMVTPYAVYDSTKKEYKYLTVGTTAPTYTGGSQVVVTPYGGYDSNVYNTYVVTSQTKLASLTESSSTLSSFTYWNGNIGIPSNNWDDGSYTVPAEASHIYEIGLTEGLGSSYWIAKAGSQSVTFSQNVHVHTVLFSKQSPSSNTTPTGVDYVSSGPSGGYGIQYGAVMYQVPSNTLTLPGTFVTTMDKWVPEYHASANGQSTGTYDGVYLPNANTFSAGSAYEKYLAPSGTTMTTMTFSGYAYNGSPSLAQPTIWALVDSQGTITPQSVWSPSVSTGSTTSTNPVTLTLPGNTVGIEYGVTLHSGSWGANGWEMLLNTPQVTLSNQALASLGSLTTVTSGLVQGAPTIPIFDTGTTLAPGWTVSGGANLYSAGSNGQPASFGGWVNGQGATTTYHFTVLPGYDPKMAYGLAKGMYKNNSAPVVVALNGKTVATSNNVGGGGSTANNNETVWEQTLAPGSYTVSIQSNNYNVYGLWTNQPQGIVIPTASGTATPYAMPYISQVTVSPSSQQITVTGTDLPTQLTDVNGNPLTLPDTGNDNQWLFNDFTYGWSSGYRHTGYPNTYQTESSTQAKMIVDVGDPGTLKAGDHVNVTLYGNSLAHSGVWPAHAPFTWPTSSQSFSNPYPAPTISKVTVYPGTNKLVIQGSHLPARLTNGNGNPVTTPYNGTVNQWSFADNTGMEIGYAPNGNPSVTYESVSSTRMVVIWGQPGNAPSAGETTYIMTTHGQWVNPTVVTLPWPSQPTTFTVK